MTAAVEGAEALMSFMQSDQAGVRKINGNFRLDPAEMPQESIVHGE